MIFQAKFAKKPFAIRFKGAFHSPFKMSEVLPRLGSGQGRIRVASLSQLDALVAEHVTGDQPQIAYQDSHGLFRFGTRSEAEEAISNSYYRLFRPDLDWESATIREVRLFPPYSTDLMCAWEVVEIFNAEEQPTEIRRQGEYWRAALAGAEAFGPTPAMAICLAALRSKGVDPVFCDTLLDERPSSIDSGHESETVEMI